MTEIKLSMDGTDLILAFMSRQNGATVTKVFQTVGSCLIFDIKALEKNESPFKDLPTKNLTTLEKQFLFRDEKYEPLGLLGLDLDALKKKANILT